MKACDQDIDLCRNWLYLVFKLEYEAKTFKSSAIKRACEAEPSHLASSS